MKTTKRERERESNKMWPVKLTQADLQKEENFILTEKSFSAILELI